MIDFIKKGMLAGVGAAVVSKESAEKALSELVEKGKISTNEAREMADKIVGQGREEYEKSRDEFQKWFEEMLHRGNVASQKDFTALEARVTALEAKVIAMDKSGE
ncbi:MAG: phasin family protein [Puniceicoccales bacterium]